MGEHGEGYVAVPGGPGANLVVVEPGFVLGRSKAFLDRPASTGHVHEFTKSRALRVMAPVERELSVVDGSADEVLMIWFARCY